MKPSIILDATISAVTRRHFEVREAPASLFARGLQGDEVIAVEMMAAPHDPDTVNDADSDGLWIPVIEGGEVKQLDTDHTVLSILSPGSYRVKTPASTAGNVVVGLYGTARQ